MKIKLNGEEKVIANGLSIAGLLNSLKLNIGAVAVEINGDIIRKPYYENTDLKEGDIIEIVHLVGGGSSPRENIRRVNCLNHS